MPSLIDDNYGQRFHTVTRRYLVTRKIDMTQTSACPITNSETTSSQPYCLVLPGDNAFVVSDGPRDAIL